MRMDDAERPFSNERQIQGPRVQRTSRPSATPGGARLPLGQAGSSAELMGPSVEIGTHNCTHVGKRNRSLFLGNLALFLSGYKNMAPLVCIVSTFYLLCASFDFL